MLAVVSPGSSVPWVGFDCIELSGVESPPTEETGVSVGGEIIAGPETVGSVSSVQPVATLAARNTPSRQAEMSRPDFRYMVMLVPLSAPFKGQCGMSHENDARVRGQRSVDGQSRYSVLRTGFRFNRHAAHQSRESPEFTRPQTPCSGSSGTRWRSTSPGVLPPSPAVPGRKSEPKTSTGQSGHYTRCILTAAFRKFIQPPVPPFLIDPFELLDTSNKVF